MGSSSVNDDDVDGREEEVNQFFLFSFIYLLFLFHWITRVCVFINIIITTTTAPKGGCFLGIE